MLILCPVKITESNKITSTAMLYDEPLSEDKSFNTVSI